MSKNITIKIKLPKSKKSRGGMQGPPGPMGAMGTQGLPGKLDTDELASIIDNSPGVQAAIFRAIARASHL